MIKKIILFVESAETAESLCRSKMTKDYTAVMTMLMGCSVLRKHGKGGQPLCIILEIVSEKALERC